MCHTCNSMFRKELSGPTVALLLDRLDFLFQWFLCRILHKMTAECSTTAMLQEQCDGPIEYPGAVVALLQTSALLQRAAA